MYIFICFSSYKLRLTAKFRAMSWRTFRPINILFFHREDGDMFLRKISWHSMDNMALSPRSTLSYRKLHIHFNILLCNFPEHYINNEKVASTSKMSISAMFIFLFFFTLCHRESNLFRVHIFTSSFERPFLVSLYICFILADLFQYYFFGHSVQIVSTIPSVFLNFKS